MMSPFLYIKNYINNKHRKMLVKNGYNVPTGYKKCKSITKELKSISKYGSIFMSKETHDKAILTGSNDLLKFMQYNLYRTKRSFIM
jgi:hypothetical protein